MWAWQESKWNSRVMPFNRATEKSPKEQANFWFHQTLHHAWCFATAWGKNISLRADFNSLKLERKRYYLISLSLIQCIRKPWVTPKAEAHKHMPTVSLKIYMPATNQGLVTCCVKCVVSGFISVHAFPSLLTFKLERLKHWGLLVSVKTLSELWRTW